MKTQNFKKSRQTFQWRKDFGPFFPVLSGVANLRRHFVGVRKLLWQLLWRFYDRFRNT